MYSVLCCGSNGAGQLGLGHEQDVSKLTDCFKNENGVLDIACGSNHTILLLKSGEAYACGNNVRNLTNMKSTDKIANTNFKLVQQEGKKFKHVGAGWDFSVFVDTNNIIYFYGDMSFSGGLKESQLKANMLSEFFHRRNDDVVGIHTSLHSIIAIYKSGCAVGWGNNKKGQIFGDCEPLGIINSPLVIAFDDIACKNGNDLHVLNCAMGRDYTFFHIQSPESQKEYIIMRSKNDRYNILKELYNLLGEGKLMGHSHKTRSRWFEIKKGIRIHHLKSMWSSIHVMYTTDKHGDKLFLKSFGNDVFNQLFPGVSDEVINFEVGTEHGVCLEKNRKRVYSWGWGEHGNCGIQQDATKVNKLYSCGEFESIDSIFCGYATTWVVVKKL